MVAVSLHSGISSSDPPIVPCRFQLLLSPQYCTRVVLLSTVATSKVGKGGGLLVIPEQHHFGRRCRFGTGACTVTGEMRFMTCPLQISLAAFPSPNREVKSGLKTEWRFRAPEFQ